MIEKRGHDAMDPVELLEYALGRLDPVNREQIDRQIARDPDLARRVTRLIRNLCRLLDDGRKASSTGLTGQSEELVGPDSVRAQSPLASEPYKEPPDCPPSAAG
jgi:anti-sigma-K factor RskA